MFDHITTRYDLSNATLEVGIILAGAFLLGFLFCYTLNRPSHETLVIEQPDERGEE